MKRSHLTNSVKPTIYTDRICIALVTEILELLPAVLCNSLPTRHFVERRLMLPQHRLFAKTNPSTAVPSEHRTEVVLSFHAATVIRLAKSNLWEEGMYLAYTCRSQTVIGGVRAGT